MDPLIVEPDTQRSPRMADHDLNRPVNDLGAERRSKRDVEVRTGVVRRYRPSGVRPNYRAVSDLGVPNSIERGLRLTGINGFKLRWAESAGTHVDIGRLEVSVLDPRPSESHRKGGVGTVDDGRRGTRHGHDANEYEDSCAIRDPHSAIIGERRGSIERTPAVGRGSMGTEHDRVTPVTIPERT
jgi:hypothetical protein